MDNHILHKHLVGAAGDTVVIVSIQLQVMDPIFYGKTFGDDALVGEQALASRHQGTPIYQGQPKYILSDINRGTYILGVCYLSYNPTPGSYYRVSNL